MKKSLFLILLSLVGTCAAGCTSKEEPDEPKKDPTEIVGISIDGDLNKKEYDYDDEWDFSGLIINAVQRNEKKVKLSSSQYTMSKSVVAPKNLAAGLSITVKYNKKKTLSDSRVFNDIFVRDEVYDEAQEKSDYYVDCNTTLTGTSLLNELHRHSFAKHTYFVKYGETNSYLRKQKEFDSPDLIPGVHNTEYFYTGKLSNYNSGTREHVWACNDSSNLWPHGVVDESDYIGGGSDLYHIRPSDSKVNTARGDAPFVDFDDFSHSYVEIGDGGPYKLKCYKRGYSSGTLEFADLVEVDDHFKGDVARIVAYLYMHYKTNSNTPSDKKSLTGGLRLTNVLGYSSDSKCIEILKKWNKLDKPSDVEKHRNHVVQQIQGNRNPFVDDYTLLDKMFN
ncbi:MAG: endonuclease [Firmicutes bacterium]|nr:endonuclease [Candidatus Fiminaster equi]